jgi:type IV secretory pathway VirB4 component
VAAAFPFVYKALSDKGGIRVGYNGAIPVFINFFQRDRLRVNSNMVIIGKSGSGKSYATKTLLTNLASEDSKVFILDPENEYGVLAENMRGKIIDVGNATQGRLNPFHIITTAEDDEDLPDDAASRGGNVSFSTHLQFLEEFFRQILPGIEPDAVEYLNNLLVRLYEDKNIDRDSDLSKLKPSDYPTFDDLYDKILSEYQMVSGAYSKANLQVLLNYISKFSTGGRNSALWNGEATISTNENFIVFNFQSLLANKNNTVANAQMLLVLKWLDNEIIKNRDYNTRFGANRRIVITIDEAHVFIDEKFPVALDFMFQMAKRIRKYNGMQIVITQNIKDFVGTEEIARKSTAIINACQYSFIFPLAPNDMHDLVRLYEKAGAINESEQEEIVNNGRGRAFVVTSAAERTCVDIAATRQVQRLFEQRGA